MPSSSWAVRPLAASEPAVVGHHLLRKQRCIGETSEAWQRSVGGFCVARVNGPTEAVAV
ncbi:MAG: hypothetical protein HY818_00045 [Acetobacterium woodii]|nr:hypothetical protein [Acetobacterium woodii]